MEKRPQEPAPLHVAVVAATMDSVAARVDALLAGGDGDGLSRAHVERAQARVHAQLTRHRDETRRLLSLTAHPLPNEHEHDAQALLAALADLETHASRAEKSVGEITAEIRWLDMAKRLSLIHI